MFGRLKDWRRVATRYDRCPKVFLSAIALAALVIYWLRVLTLIMFANVSDIGISGITAMRLFYNYDFLSRNQQIDRQVLLPTDGSVIESLPFPVRRWSMQRGVTFETL